MTPCRSIVLVAAFGALALAVAACKEESGPARPGKNAEMGAAPTAPETPKPTAPKIPPAPALEATPTGLPELEVPEANPLTAEKAWLGKQLFFDKRLSGDGSASCETCHQHDKGWTDGLPLSVKVGGATNTRHTPTLYNVGYANQGFYWDGRARTLEDQITAAWKGQMGADPEKVAAALAGIPGYQAQFEKVFGTGPTAENIPMALAAYVRTLRSGDSRWDRFDKGDRSALTEDEQAGWKIFTTKAQCALCHIPPHFTDFAYHNVGLEHGREKPDEGRGKISGQAAEMHAFKTPTLRSISRSAPYFHDGRAATLEEAVRYMLSGGPKGAKGLDPKLREVKLTDKEFEQLIAFLKSLDSPEPFEKPWLPE